MEQTQIDKIEKEVQEREKVVRDLLGADFPMLDWYMGNYTDYFRKVKQVEAINKISTEHVYIIDMGELATISMIADESKDIDAITKGYPDLVSKNDKYGFILYLINEHGFRMAKTAYSLDMDMFIDDESQKNFISHPVAFDNTQDDFADFLHGLNAEQMVRFANMVKKTEILDMDDVEDLTPDEKEILDAHNESVQEALHHLANTKRFPPPEPKNKKVVLH